jgi:hypothetical protein
MMGRTVVVVAMLVVRGAAAGPACVAQADADATQATTTKANEARFAKARDAKKLTSVTLDHVDLGAAGIDAPAGFDTDHVRAAKFQGADVNTVTWLVSRCGQWAEAEFAQQGAKVVRIERDPIAGKAIALTVCGCPIPQFKCGGARPAVQPIGYVLPAGTTYGGVVRITYTFDQMTIGTAASCPPIQPPP